MASTYTKPLKTAAFKTLGGTTVTVADTAADPKGSNALAEFEKFMTVHADGTLIPFHAIDSVVVTVTESEEITKPDPYCGE